MLSSFGYHSTARSKFQDVSGSRSGLPLADALPTTSLMEVASSSSTLKLRPKPRSAGSGRDRPRKTPRRNSTSSRMSTTALKLGNSST